MTWIIEESGDPELGYLWNILESDGTKAICAAQCFDERMAERIVSALKWQDALGSGLVKLAQDGITIDSNTGKVWTPPKGKRAPALKIEPARRRKA